MALARSIDPLRAVKLVHTAVWAFFVLCIVAIPVLTAGSHFQAAGACAAIVGVEVVVLLLNGMACPLTDVAARHTSDRRANFDIYLPEWLARHNKMLFGTVYVLSILFLLARWSGDQ